MCVEDLLDSEGFSHPCSHWAEWAWLLLVCRRDIQAFRGSKRGGGIPKDMEVLRTNTPTRSSSSSFQLLNLYLFHEGGEWDGAGIEQWVNAHPQPLSACFKPSLRERVTDVEGGRTDKQSRRLHRVGLSSPGLDGTWKPWGAGRMWVRTFYPAGPAPAPATDFLWISISCSFLVSQGDHDLSISRASQLQERA